MERRRVAVLACTCVVAVAILACTAVVAVIVL